MTRGIPWDDLPNMYEDVRNKSTGVINEDNSREVKKKPPHVFHLTNDLASIGKRVAFGVTVSFI